MPGFDVLVRPVVRTPEDVAKWVQVMDDAGVEMEVSMAVPVERPSVGRWTYIEARSRPVHAL